MGSPGDLAETIRGEALLAAYLDEVAKYHDSIWIQPVISGLEYRIFLVDDEVVYSARKYPRFVLGDGVRSIGDLLIAHNEALRSRGLSPVSVPPNASLDIVLPEGERWDIPGRMNLMGGGTLVLEAPPSDAGLTLAKKAARALGLRVAAVDMLTDIGGVPEALRVNTVN